MNDKIQDISIITIFLAVNEDEESIMVIIDHYNSYINHLCKKRYVEGMRVTYIVDDEMKGIIIQHLIMAILRFNIYNH